MALADVKSAKLLRIISFFVQSLQSIDETALVFYFVYSQSWIGARCIVGKCRKPFWETGIVTENWPSGQELPWNRGAYGASRLLARIGY
jgi:hypothetical protein